MRNNIFFLATIVLFVFSDKTFAQLYVSNNSYVFNRGGLVYARTDVNLGGVNSNFYLRNEGQLLQGGTTLGGSNQGLGSLSVFQESTANNYGYNYWCSPVGVPAAPAGNNSFALDQVVKRPTGLTTMQTPTFVNFTDGYTTASALTISNRWIYQFAVSDNYSAWSYAGASGAVAAGKGFTMKGVSGDDATAVGELTVNNPVGAGGLNDYQRYDFRGKPNEGTIQIPVAAQIIGTQYPNSTLTGNPYPSAINLNYFLLENSGYNVNYLTGAVTAGGPLNVINGNAYFWEHEKPATSHILVQYIGGYGYYVPNNVNANSPGTYNSATWNTYNLDGSLNTTGGSSGSNYKRMFSPVGQGFMVEGLANGNALMKNAYRVFVKEGFANDSQFERSNIENNATIEPQNWGEIPNVAGVDYTQFSRLEVPQIKIHTVINNLFTKEITMAFNPNALDGYDQAYDAKTYEGSFPNDANFSVVGNPNNFIITTLPFDIDKRIPFTLKATEQSTFKVSVGNLINFDGSENVYIYDNTTGLYHDILNDFYQIVLSPGVYANRFEITFKNDALDVDNNIKDNFAIVQNNSNQLLSISNPNAIEVNSVELFDIAGKLIFNKIDLGAKTIYEFPTSSLSDGVYIVRLNTQDSKNVAQKIIVEKAK